MTGTFSTRGYKTIEFSIAVSINSSYSLETVWTQDTPCYLIEAVQQQCPKLQSQVKRDLLQLVDLKAWGQRLFQLPSKKIVCQKELR